MEPEKKFRIAPVIRQFDTVESFCRVCEFEEDDLIFVSHGTYEGYFAGKTGKARIVNYRKFGSGEPTDQMVEGICEELKDFTYKRVFAIGGGTILDVAKLFALKQVSPVTELFEGKIVPEKIRKLILVPTTCGTGSEVTNISILELTQKNTKFGLASDTLFADEAVLIPELLEKLPDFVFATSSIDALIHSMESFTSPKATKFSIMYSKQAMQMILEVYKDIRQRGKSARKDHLENLLLASTYAGIAFGNAGCAAVHAMSYPLGASHHVPHGESNYVFLLPVYRMYEKKIAEMKAIEKKAAEMNTSGQEASVLGTSESGASGLGASVQRLKDLKKVLSEILNVSDEDTFWQLAELLACILPPKCLSDYGVAEEELEDFAETVMTKQGRLMGNNAVPLTRDDVLEIYRNVFRKK
ncbi:MAG: 4-hydroxybutyrate dehydrogenase [Eubacteriales bacterium]|nr:4-hydroxybutyrate dehydrogenase [Eubacteriales bacterium]